MSVLLATLAAGSASEVGPSENINCTYMLNKLTQRKPVLGERASDAARQHAHIDTNRTYNARPHATRHTVPAHSPTHTLCNQRCFTLCHQWRERHARRERRARRARHHAREQRE